MEHINKENAEKCCLLCLHVQALPADDMWKIDAKLYNFTCYFSHVSFVPWPEFIMKNVLSFSVADYKDVGLENLNDNEEINDTSIPNNLIYVCNECAELIINLKRSLDKVYQIRDYISNLKERLQQKIIQSFFGPSVQNEPQALRDTNKIEEQEEVEKEAGVTLYEGESQQTTNVVKCSDDATKFSSLNLDSVACHDEFAHTNDVTNVASADYDDDIIVLKVIEKPKQKADIVLQAPLSTKLEKSECSTLSTNLPHEVNSRTPLLDGDTPTCKGQQLNNVLNEVLSRKSVVGYARKRRRPCFKNVPNEVLSIENFHDDAITRKRRRLDNKSLGDDYACDTCGKKLRNCLELLTHKRVYHKDTSICLCYICVAENKDMQHPASHSANVSKVEKRRTQLEQNHRSPSSDKSVIPETSPSIEKDDDETISEPSSPSPPINVSAGRIVHTATSTIKTYTATSSTTIKTTPRLYATQLVKRRVKFPHECKICEKSFAQKNALELHMKKLHPFFKLYKCWTCNRVLKPFDFLRHMQSCILPRTKITYSD